MDGENRVVKLVESAAIARPGGEDDNRPVIDLEAGKLPQITRQATTAVKAACSGIYDRGGQLVRTVRIAEPEAGDGVRRPTGALVLKPVELDWLRLRLAEAAIWRKFDGRAKAWRVTNPPLEHARIVLAAPDEGGWPVLGAIARHPVLTPDGRRIERAGQAFGLEPTTAADAINRAETRPELQEALSMIATRRGRLEVNALGYWLRKHRDTRAGRFTLRRSPDTAHGGVTRWQVTT